MRFFWQKSGGEVVFSGGGWIFFRGANPTLFILFILFTLHSYFKGVHESPFGRFIHLFNFSCRCSWVSRWSNCSAQNINNQKTNRFAIHEHPNKWKEVSKSACGWSRLSSGIENKFIQGCGRVISSGDLLPTGFSIGTGERFPFLLASSFHSEQAFIHLFSTACINAAPSLHHVRNFFSVFCLSIANANLLNTPSRWYGVGPAADRRTRMELVGGQTARRKKSGWIVHWMNHRGRALPEGCFYNHFAFYANWFQAPEKDLRDY